MRKESGTVGVLGSGLLATLTARVLASAMLLVALMAVGLAALLLSLASVDRARVARSRAESVVRVSDAALKAVLDMETGLRGYMLTHDKRFLEPYDQGRAAFRSSFSRASVVAGTVLAGGGIDRTASEIGRQGSAYIRDYGDPIVRHGIGAGSASATLIDGKRRVDALRVLFDRLLPVNGQRENRALGAARAAASRTRSIALIGASAALLLIGLAAWYLMQRVSRPIRGISAAAKSLGDGDGEVLVLAPEQGPGEIQQLGRSFNSMARSIADGRETMRSQNDALDQTRLKAERVAAALAAQQELAVDLIATAGFDGYFKTVNPAWGRALGYSTAELTSHPFIDFVHSEDRERTMAEAAKLAEAGVDTINFENRYRTKAGAYRWLDWNVRAVAEEELLYAVARDVTDRKLADETVRESKMEADRANQAKSEFLSRMSHELRTPMNAVLGFGQLLGTEDLSSRQRESVDQIMRGGAHLLGLIDEVLDISRIESGAFRLSVEAVELASALNEAVELMHPVAAQRQITLLAELDAPAAIFVSADQQRLRQVILNLLSNAVKYNHEGGEVRLSTRLSGTGRVQIAVADNGPGIDPANHQRLFEPFDRLDTEGGAVEGTGLGLALSRSLAGQMNGSLTVVSELGRGSVFTLELDRASNPVTADTLDAARERKGGEARMGLGTVLCIEDNPANVSLLERLLCDQPGVRIVSTAQGRIGLDLARADQPDLILLDLDLPDIGGAVVLEQLQADPATRTIPVLVLSARATEPEITRLRTAGATAFVAKPLDLAVLSDLISKHLPAPECVA